MSFPPFPSALFRARNPGTILSGLTVKRLTTTTANISVNVSVTNGRVYAVAVANGSATPTRAQILAGQNGSGTTAVWANSVPISSVDSYSLGPTGLTGGVDYDIHVTHDNSFSNLLSADLSSDITAPTISSRTPSDEDAGVAVDVNPTVTFSKNVTFGTGVIEIYMDDGSLTLVESFNVETEQGTSPGQVGISGAVLTLYKTADFTAGVNYSIRIGSTAIKDTTNGNYFAGIANDTDWNFSTTNVLDVVIHNGQSLSIGTDPDFVYGDIVSLDGSPIAISNIDIAVTPVVVTTTSPHGQTGRFEALFKSIGGTTQMNERTYECLVTGASTLALYYLDGESPSATPITNSATSPNTALSAYTSGGTLTKTANVNPKAFMFNGGVRAHYDNVEALSNPNAWVYADTMKAIIPLRERTQTDRGETLASGASEALTGNSLHVATGRGGYTVSQLTYGTFHFNNTYAAALHAKIYGEAAGYQVRLAPMIWKQGEGDAVAATTRASYVTQLQDLHGHFVKALQHAMLQDMSDFKMITDQVGANSSAYGLIACAALDLHRNNQGVICIGPTYGPEYVYTGANDVHITAAGYRKVGKKFGIAKQIILDGGDWHPLHITAYSRVGTKITLTIRVPYGPMVVDTTLVATVANKGFTYTGANITAVNITDTGVDGTGVIEIDLDASAGGTLSVAFNNGTTANYTGSTFGPRSNIRDSAPFTAYDATPLYNWLCVDQMVVS